MQRINTKPVAAKYEKKGEEQSEKDKSLRVSYKFSPVPLFRLLGTQKYDEALIPGTLIFSLKLIGGDMCATHVAMYTPKLGEFSDICHATTKDVTRHTLAFLVSTFDEKTTFAICKPKDLEMGRLAAEQARFWSQTNTQFDPRKLNMTELYSRAPKEMKKSEMFFQDSKNFAKGGVFQILKLMTREKTKPVRNKMDEKEERGFTCGGFVVGCYNVSQFRFKLNKHVKIDPERRYSIKYSSVFAESAQQTPGYCEYVRFLRTRPQMLEHGAAMQKRYVEHTVHKHQSESKSLSCDATPVVEILPEIFRKNIDQLTKYAPFQVDPKYLDIGELFNLLFDPMHPHPHFDIVGITKIDSASPENGRELNRKEKLAMSMFARGMRRKFIDSSIENSGTLSKFRLFIYFNDEDIATLLFLSKSWSKVTQEYINIEKRTLAPRL